MEAAIVEFHSGSDQIDQKIAELWAILDGDTNSPTMAATGTPATGCAPTKCGYGLSVISYNPGNLRRLVLPKRIDHWSLTVYIRGW